MDSRNRLLLESSPEAYSHFVENSTSLCSSGSSSLNSTLSAHEGSMVEENAAIGWYSSPERQQRCLHCERKSSECICLDSEDEDDGKVQEQHPYTELKLHLRESCQPPPASEAIIQEAVSENLTPARFRNYTSKQRVERQEQQQQQQQQQHRGLHQPLPSFEQLLASLGLAAGFVIYRNRHQ